MCRARQMQSAIQGTAGISRSAQNAVQHIRSAIQPMRTDLDSIQRQVGELKRTQDSRHAATQQQLRAAARMMAAVYPEFIAPQDATDDFTRTVAEEMQRLADEADSDDPSDTE